MLIKSLHLHLFEVNEQILSSIQKHVHISKINEIGNKQIFHLVINIIINNDNFHYICNVSKSQCIDALCIMLFYHHECQNTYVFCK
jgi:hypothetical protein